MEITQCLLRSLSHEFLRPELTLTNFQNHKRQPVRGALTFYREHTCTPSGIV